MNINGKLLAGIIGMVLLDLTGMPFGALVGFIMGVVVWHVYEHSKSLEEDERAHRETQRRRGAFVYYLLCLCARLAKADGPINRQEIQFMEQLMRQRLRLSEQGRRDAIRVWNDAKQSETAFNDYAQAFYRDFAQQRHMVLDMLDLLFALAAADSTRLHPAEEALLLRAAALFHISRLQFDRIKSRYFEALGHQQKQPSWSPLDPHYAILGASPSDSLEVIKRKFRQLAFQWHPDRVQARGGSSEAIRHAHEKFRQINEAYEKIIESRRS